MGILTDEQEQLRVVSALRCTPSGKEMYEELKSLLMVLTQKKGPKAFTLAPNSTVSAQLSVLHAQKRKSFRLTL